MRGAPAHRFAPIATLAAGLALLAVGCTTTSPPDVAPPPPAAAVEPTPLPDLWAAAGSSDIDALKAHREAGTNLDGLHPDVGITPLVAAIAARQPEAVRWLLDNGADVDARTGDGGSALISAAFMGEAEIAKMLLDVGADVSIRNDGGQTVWDMAGLDWQMTQSIADFLGLEVERGEVVAGRAEIVALLEPALNNLAQNDVWTAAIVGDIDAVRTQIAGGLDIDVRNPEGGATLLTMAALFGHTELVALLIDAGANVNKTNYQDGSTALHAAAFLGRADVVGLLLDHGADANAMSDQGGTPLMAAELDWATTEYVAATMQIPLDEPTMKPGKAKAAELLRAKLGQ